MTSQWISAETRQKERDFRGVLNMHIRMAKSIIARYAAPPYLYVDMHAGPGQLEDELGPFDGSPLIFAHLANEHDLPHLAWHFDESEVIATQLLATLGPESFVGAVRCEDGLPVLVDRISQPTRRYGLIYADPIGKEIPVDALNTAADRLPRVDLMAYVSGTAYKRRRNGRLFTDVSAIRKKHALVREPQTAWQWTFVLWTNWADFPEWRKRGFYRADSTQGRRILDELNYTRQEIQERDNTPLPDVSPYATYREYLRHPRFLKVRAHAFARADGVCEKCHERPPTEPHHLRYPPWGHFDVPENLLAVCHQCHCEIHGKAS